MLYVVGFGCGNREGMTFAAYDAIERSDLVIGYSTYIDLIYRFIDCRRHILIII